MKQSTNGNPVNEIWNSYGISIFENTNGKSHWFPKSDLDYTHNITVFQEKCDGLWLYTFSIWIKSITQGKKKLFSFVD